jgi:hypothetical protein
MPKWYGLQGLIIIIIVNSPSNNAINNMRSWAMASESAC